MPEAALLAAKRDALKAVEEQVAWAGSRVKGTTYNPLAHPTTLEEMELFVATGRGRNFVVASPEVIKQQFPEADLDSIKDNPGYILMENIGNIGFIRA